jgi:hypothetical protein
MRGLEGVSLVRPGLCLRTCVHWSSRAARHCLQSMAHKIIVSMGESLQAVVRPMLNNTPGPLTRAYKRSATS